MRYTAEMPDTHHLAKPEQRKRIREMLDSGMSQAAIARQLHKSVSTINFHVQNLGIEPKEYTTPEPVRGMWPEQDVGRVSYPSRRSLQCLPSITAQGVRQLMEMIWMFSTELGFVAGATVALYLDASNTVICASAFAGALIATGVRQLLKVKRDLSSALMSSCLHFLPFYGYCMSSARNLP